MESSSLAEFVTPPLLVKKPHRIIYASTFRFHPPCRTVRTNIIAGDWTNAKSCNTGWEVVLMLRQIGGNTYPSAIENFISWCWTTGSQCARSSVKTWPDKTQLQS